MDNVLSLADWRDVVIIVYGVLGALLFVLLIVVVVAAYFLLRSVTKSFKSLVEDPVRPTLEEIRQTAANTRTASEFYADHAVSPLIKTVAAVRGVRRGVQRVSRLAKRGKD
ncbi:MAG: hypothetical protein R3C39_04195 [Dehalococcoidia bacterium]